MDAQNGHRRSNRGVYNHSASRSSSFLIGKRGTAGRPAPSWSPNIKRDSTYDSRPPVSIRKVKAEFFREVEPEIGSRVFISGLPKDITNQDLEDFVSQSIGPVHEAYVVYQYGGSPLYTDATPTAGARRNYDAEIGENMRYVTSTGCGMVHFQRAKDAIEAWEQFNGRIFDTNNNQVLRVQVVLDPDDSWLLPLTDQTTLEIASPPDSGLPPGTPSTMGTRANGTELGTRVKQYDFRSNSTSQPTSTPLIQRLGYSEQSTKVVTLGSHLVGSSSAVPRGKAKRGPARLTKAKRRNQYTSKIVAGGAETMHLRRQPTVQDLDADIDQYRLSGRMGFDSAKMH